MRAEGIIRYVEEKINWLRLKMKWNLYAGDETMEILRSQKREWEILLLKLKGVKL